jgi:nucleotide-binding universal stress UspA family protein
MGARRHELVGGGRAVFGHTVDYVLRNAPCRVMVAAPEREAA